MAKMNRTADVQLAPSLKVRPQSPSPAILSILVISGSSSLSAFFISTSNAGAFIILELIAFEPPPLPKNNLCDASSPDLSSIPESELPEIARILDSTSRWTTDLLQAQSSWLGRDVRLQILQSERLQHLSTAVCLALRSKSCTKVLLRTFLDDKAGGQTPFAIQIAQSLNLEGRAEFKRSKG